MPIVELCTAQSRPLRVTYSLSQDARYAGAGASEAAVLDAATRRGAYPVNGNQHRQSAIINAALTYLDVDPTFIVERLGSGDREGLQRIKEICTSPMSHQVESFLPSFLHMYPPTVPF